MVKISRFVGLLVLLLLPLTQASGKSSSSLQWRICGTIASGMITEFIDEGKDIPFEWDELIYISSLKDGRLEPNIKAMEIVNSFVLVQQKPMICKDTTVPQKYEGKRLLMIGRQREVDSVTKFLGRYVIFWGTRRMIPDQLFIEVDFIPENLALGILAQMPDFDPSAQPLAFNKMQIEKVREDKRVSQKKLEKSVRDWDRREKQRQSGDPSAIIETSRTPFLKWILILLFVSFTVLLAIYKIRRRSQTN